VFAPGEVISYLEMCREEDVNLERGMNYRSGGRPSVILMSLRPGAPYDDRVEQDGRVLIYEGVVARIAGAVGQGSLLFTEWPRLPGALASAFQADRKRLPCPVESSSSRTPAAVSSVGGLAH
jgi:hypothetical protein